MLAKLRCGAWIERVPTKENIADDPSREHYDLLHKLPGGAKWVPPVLHPTFERPAAWESLSLICRQSGWKDVVSLI